MPPRMKSAGDEGGEQTNDWRSAVIFTELENRHEGVSRLS